MARSHARVLVSIWTDEDFRSLSRDAQHLYFTLLSQPSLNYCGVLAHTPGRWARLCGDADATVTEAALTELAERDFVTVDADTEEVWVRSFVRHNSILGSGHVEKAMWAAHRTILSEVIKARFDAEYGDAAAPARGSRRRKNADAKRANADALRHTNADADGDDADALRNTNGDTQSANADALRHSTRVAATVPLATAMALSPPARRTVAPEAPSQAPYEAPSEGTRQAPSEAPSEAPYEAPSRSAKNTLNEPLDPSSVIVIGKGIGTNPLDTSGSETRGRAQPFGDDFTAWWQAWPKKVDRKAAYQRYAARRREGVPAAVLLTARDGYLAQLRDVQYCKHGATFLNGSDGPWSEFTDGPAPDTGETVEDVLPPFLAVSVAEEKLRERGLTVDVEALDAAVRTLQPTGRWYDQPATLDVLAGLLGGEPDGEQEFAW